MRVLLIHQMFASGDTTGGTRHWEFGRHLHRRGDEMTVIASQVDYLTGTRRTKAGRKLFVDTDEEGVHVTWANALPRCSSSTVWRLVMFCFFALLSIAGALRAPKPDVVMGTTPPIFQAVSASIVARLRRRPFLLEVRDLWPAFLIDMGVLRSPILIRAARALERYLYRRADHLLVNSPAYRDYLLDNGVPVEKVTLVPNGVDSHMFDPERRGAGFREAHGFDGRFLAVYAGAHGKANALDVLVEAAERLREVEDIQIVFVGDGPERPRLLSTCADRGLANVTFVEPVSKREMPEVLAAADACIATLMDIPMFATTYPNKVFDYMAAGRPTVLAIDGVIRGVIERAGAGIFVPPADSEALARAIVRLRDDSGLRREMGDRARHYVAEHFDRSRQAEDFRRLLHGLAFERAPVPDHSPEVVGS